MAKQAPSHFRSLHRLVFEATTHNFSVAMSYSGCNNKIANALSRNKLTVFCTLIPPYAEPLSTQLPPDLDDI